jgi:hypothetical protein
LSMSATAGRKQGLRMEFDGQILAHLRFNSN